MTEKRLNRKDFYLIITVCLFCLAVAAMITHGEYLYGSQTDWESQHAVLPEYFRNLFYETGELFPSLAPAVGAGENIYFFSYYGLLSPVILLSYLFPFVSMTAYLMAAALISVLLSVTLFYLWARKRFDRTITFVLDLMLAFSGSLLFHSHRHIMFVIYMPLLIAALHFTDRYFEKSRLCGLAVCTALIIFTSYFFSVTSILVITLYAIFCFAERREAEERGKLFPDLLKSGGFFAGLIVVGILLAGVLLLPTARALLIGRDTGNVGIGWRELLPTVDLEDVTFGTYSLGLSSFCIFAIFDQLLHRRFAGRFLAAVFVAILLFPVIIYLLNGGQYLDGKVMIPFLPLALILCGNSLKRIFEGKLRLRFVLPVFVCISALGLLVDDSSIHRKTYMVDFALVILFVILCSLKNKKISGKIVLPLILIIPLGACITVNLNDSLVPIADYKVMNSDDLTALFVYLAENDPGFYRTAVNIDASNTANKVYAVNHYSDTVYSSLEDRDYNHFVFEEMCGENSYRNRAILSRIKNPCFNLYMGNRYWITTSEGYVPIGYTEIARRGDYVLYQTNDVLPLGYTTDALMSRTEFEKLTYPERVEALLRYTVVEKDLPDTGFSGSMTPVNLDGIFDDCPFLLKTADGYRFDRDADESQMDGDFRIYRYTLPEECEGRQVLLRFKVNNTVGEESEDVKIWVNGVANKLTDADWRYYNHNESFEYGITLWGENGRDLAFRFPEEDYTVRDVEVWLLDPSMLSDLSGGVDAFVCDRERTGGDVICGTIHAQKDGYFNLSFVYGEGYRVTVDGVEVEAERVDTCFLGFPIDAGDHEIVIRYTAPGLTAGKILSGIGLVCLIGLAVCDLLAIRREKAEKKNSHFHKSF